MSSPSKSPVTEQPDLGEEMLLFDNEVKEEAPLPGPRGTRANEVPPAPPPAPGPAETPATEPEDLAHDLLLYGNEEMLRGSDTGVLVAFAAIALKELKGDKEPHFEIGFGFLLFSVLMCAVIHFAVGKAYIRRAKKLLRGQKDPRPQVGVRGLYMLVAWLAGLIQLACIVIGLLLVLLPEPPTLLKEYLLPYFQ
jgi:hypothetical protein